MFCHGLHAQGSCSAARSGIVPGRSMQDSCSREAAPFSPLPLGGRGWGRASRRDGSLPGAAASADAEAGPHPASPASGARGNCCDIEFATLKPRPSPSCTFVPPSRFVPFRSSRRRLPRSSGTLFRAYRARPPAPVGAGAVRAPDCACAREPGRRAHFSRPFLWIFFAPARNGKGSSPADAAPFLLSHTSTDFQRSSPHKELFQTFCEPIALAAGPAAVSALLYFGNGMC